MKYQNQLFTVTFWEYRRFFKPKKELLGIAVMLVLFTFIYFGGKYAMSVSKEKSSMMVLENIDPQLTNLLSEAFEVEKISIEKKGKYLAQIQNTKKDCCSYIKTQASLSILGKDPLNSTNYRKS